MTDTKKQPALFVQWDIKQDVLVLCASRHVGVPLEIEPAVAIEAVDEYGTILMNRKQALELIERIAERLRVS